jgi:hypothetical protein
MDFKSIKNGNDFLMQMYNDTQAAEGEDNPQNVDVNAGAVAPSVETQTTDTDEKIVDSDLELVDPDNQDNSTDDYIDLDGDSQEPAKTVEPKFDFSELGKALQIEGIDSKDSLVAKWKEVSQKTKEYEDKLAAYNSIPEPLREAIELANRGGDYLEYLGVSTIDYDGIDDRSLVEEELIELGIFNNADGSINEDALAEYVDGLSDKELKVRGAQVRYRFKNTQAAQKQEQIRKAEESKQRAISDMRVALDKLNNIGPFKLNQARKKELFDSFSSGQMLKELFQNEKGQFDYTKAAEVYYRVKYAPKIDKLVADYAKTETIKKQASEIKNIDLGVNTRLARPEASNTQEDPMDAYMRKLQGLIK